MRHALLTLLLLLGLAGCASAPASPSATPSSVSSPASPSTSRAETPGSPSATSGASPAAVKAPLGGLIDRQGVPDGPRQSNADLITGVVVNLDWAEAEPQAGRIDTALIDQRLAEVDAFAAKIGHPVKVRLRVVGGLKAPDWLKDRTGRVHVVHKAGNDNLGVDDFEGDFPKWWTDAYKTAYDDLQTRLAQRYDADERLADVVIARCVTVWAEPYIRQGDKGVTQPLFAAGFSIEADQACLAQQIEAHAVWKRTPSVLSLNPYQKIAATGRLGTDVATSIRDMDSCRRVLGERCVLANNSLRSPLQGDEYAQLYPAITQRGRPISFQTAQRSRIGDLPASLDWAADEARACSVELPAGYGDQSFAPHDRLAAAAKRLTANCAQR